MKKDAYYFPHFCNARHDRKLKRVQKELGVEGYGIFFMILEVLREQPDFKYPMEDLDLLADEFGTSEQKVNTVVCNYKLFDIDIDKNFTSDKMVLYLQPYIERSIKARNAAKARWDAIKNNAQALPEHSASNPQAMQGKETKPKQSEEEESKGKEYSDEIKNFTNSYQEYVLTEFPKVAPEIENSLIEKCCDTIDKLIRLDSFTFKEIFDSIQWASNDDFWSDQILSLAQLRKKAPNGNKKFVNMYTAYQKKDSIKLNPAEKRLQSNLEVSRRFLNE